MSLPLSLQQSARHSDTLGVVRTNQRSETELIGLRPNPQLEDPSHATEHVVY